MGEPKKLEEQFGSKAKAALARTAVSEYVSRWSLILGFAKAASSDIRSGFCVTLDGKFFVVTAAHELDDANLSMVVVVSRPEMPLVEVKDPRKVPHTPGYTPVLTVTGHRKLEDPADILVMRVDRMPDSDGWLVPYDLGGCDIRAPQVDQVAVLSGIPGQWTIETPDKLLGRTAYCPSPLHIYTHTIAPPSGLPNYDPEYHVLLKYKFDPGDEVMKDLSPRGMSGGPIYQLPAMDNLWSPTKGNLIGVQQSRYTNFPEVLKATRIAHVVNLVREMM